MTTWNYYFTGTQENVVIANTQISSNCGLPFGGTSTWAIPQQAYLQDFWFIPMPPPEGWIREDGTFFSQSAMINDVVNVTEEQSQSNWWPPFPPGV